MRLGVVALGLGLSAAACSTRASNEARQDPELPVLARLNDYQSHLRATMEPQRFVAADRVRGPDPSVVALVPRTDRVVGLLRGSSELVLLDGELRELARTSLPETATSLATGEDGLVVVTAGTSVLRFHARQDSFVSLPARTSPAAVSLRDVAVGPYGDVIAIDEVMGSLLAWPNDSRAPVKARHDDAPLVQHIGEGPFRVARVGGFVLVASLFEHAVIVRPVDGKGAPIEGRDSRITHDGPIWSFAAIPDREGLLVATGGVEDHPLDRSQGSFGYIDSFVWLDRVVPGAPPERLAAVNVSELGVLTPKALLLERTQNGVRLVASGYGGDVLATLDFEGGVAHPPRTSTRPVAPGIASLVRTPSGLYAANPLLDAWTRIPDEGAERIAPIGSRDTGDRERERDRDLKIGEALFYTRLMAPWNETAGYKSRFTCETCHFDGYVDGRTHSTGRGDVAATTKPLIGLLNNRPHFSRALDPDLVAVAYNEFKVAGANSGHDAWFSIGPKELPWLPRLGAARELSPEDLRRALIAFLASQSFGPNPRAAGRTAFSADEREGAKVFADRCESCHEARLISDDPASRRPSAGWEALIFTRQGPIVWAKEQLVKTGVTPYVNDEGGARVPSLRRLYKKRPYFTNGSAKTLDDVLARATWSENGFLHAGGVASASALTTDERARLRAFLDLL